MAKWKMNERDVVHVFVEYQDLDKKYPRTIVVSFAHRVCIQSNNYCDMYQVYCGRNHASYANTLPLDSAIELAKSLAHWPGPACAPDSINESTL